MWQVFKAEMDAYRVGFLIVFLIVSSMFVTDALLSDWSVPQFLSNTAVTFAIATGILGSKGDKEKRDRHIYMLPLTPRQGGLIRLAYMFAMQAALWPLWLLFMLVGPLGFQLPMLWQMFAMTGIFMSIIMLFVIHHDCGFFFTRKYRVRNLVGVAVVVLLFIAAGINGFFDNLHMNADSLLRTPRAALVYNVVFGLLLLTSLAVFRRRKSYLA
jgi:hypothetical protein